MSRLTAIEIDESGLAVPSPELEQERRVAIFDLVEENRFSLPDGALSGPYSLRLSLRERALVFDVTCLEGKRAAAFSLLLGPLRQVMKDYFRICEGYRDAVRRLPPAQIEAIDEGRRAIHDEGSKVLLQRLDGKVVTDLATARRLFTLICALHPEGA
ncbi:MAG: UPF0262 family protein [Pseudomonadota bacterium]